MPSTRKVKPPAKFTFDESHVVMSKRKKKSRDKKKAEENKNKDNERKQAGAELCQAQFQLS